jgi:methyl-accepting chemotaxis protein
VTHHDSLGRALRRLLLFDLLIMIAHGGMWVAMGLVTPMVIVLTSAVRLSLWLGYAQRLLGPVRDWIARGDRAGDDRELLAAHESLDGFGRRIGLAHVGSWLLLDAIWLLLTYLGIPEPLPVGRIEMLAAAMLAASLLLTPLLLEPAIDHTLSRLHEQVRRTLVEHRRPLQVSGPTIARVVMRLVTGIFLATLTGLAGASILFNAAHIREAAIAEQRRLVEVSAVRAEIGLDPLEGVAFVEHADLPPELAHEVAQLPERAAITIHDPRREEVFAAAPLADGRWAVTSSRPDQQIGLSLLSVAALAILIAPIFVFVGWAYARSIMQPIEHFTATMERFSTHGELRGLARIIPLRGNDVGRLSDGFNRMLDILEELAQAAKAVANGDLGVELQRPGELQDAFRGMLARLNEIVGRMRETALEVGSAAAEIQALTREQHDAAERQSSGVQQISATIVSLAEAAQSIAVTAHGVLDNAERTVETTDAMSGKIAELRGHAASVTALLEVIREISDRSDLLALNGSLEATRVGEAGRGFALVANEMRRLAERVTKTVADVRTQVTNIESSGSNTVMATEHSRKLAQATAEAARQISTVTQRQSTHTSEVALGMQELAQEVVASTAAVSQTHAAAEGLRAHASELERLLASFRTAGTR